MERFGTAWEKIQGELALGYPEPTLDGGNPVFQATLWPHPSFAQPRHHEVGDVRDVRDAGRDVGDADDLGDVRDRRRDGVRQAAQRERREALLNAIADSEGLTFDELVERAAVSRPTVQRDLRALRESDGVALDRDGRYRVPRSQPAS